MRREIGEFPRRGCPRGTTSESVNKRERRPPGGENRKLRRPKRATTGFAVQVSSSRARSSFLFSLGRVLRDTEYICLWRYTFSTPVTNKSPQSSALTWDEVHFASLWSVDEERGAFSRTLVCSLFPALLLALGTFQGSQYPPPVAPLPSAPYSVSLVFLALVSLSHFPSRHSTAALVPSSGHDKLGDALSS